MVEDYWQIPVVESQLAQTFFYVTADLCFSSRFKAISNTFTAFTDNIPFQLAVLQRWLFDLRPVQ